MSRRFKCFIAPLMLLSATAFSQPSGAGNIPLPLDPQVKTGKLPNGFTYYIRHNTEPQNRVIFYLANKVGSIVENDQQQGLAHFMEHMSFNGTTHFPKNQLVDYLQKAGVRFGADINAYTNFDETVYQLPLPTDNPEILNHGLTIMRDWAHEALLEPAEIDKERGVVLEEARLGKGAAERMRRVYFPVLLNQSRYAERIPIGKEEILTTFKPQTIKDYYNTWYRPDLQALIVVGDVDVKWMEQEIIKRFSDLKNPANEKDRIAYGVPLTGRNQFMTVTDKEETRNSIEVIFKGKSGKLITAFDYNRQLTRQLLNAMLGQRYAELLLKPNPPFLQAGASISSFMGGLDMFDISCQPQVDKIEDAFKASWREIERIKRFGFTATELERARKAYLSNLENVYRERNKINSNNYVQEYLSYFLKQEAAPGIETEYALVKDILPKIDLNQINTLVRSWIKDTDRDILVTGAESAKSQLPTETILLKWMTEVSAESLQPYRDEVSNRSLFTSNPVPGKIVSVNQDKLLNVITYTLSNGVKVLVKPTDFKNNEVIFNSFGTGGTANYNDADYMSVSNATGILAAGGIGNYNVTELSKFLTGKQVGVKSYIGERMHGINGSSTVADMETAMQLIYAAYTQPRLDTAVFKNIISRSKAGLENRANDPNSVFSDTVSAVLSNHNFRRMGPSLTKLDMIKPDRALAIYNELFTDASSSTFIFTGSVDTAALRPLLMKYLAALPVSADKIKMSNLDIPIPQGKISRNVYKGTEPKSTVLMVFSGDMPATDKERLRLRALKEVLSIRLIERLREEESGVYSPAAFANLNKLPQSRYSFVIQFGCAPQNVDKLVASALDEINKIKTDGPAEVNLEKWKTETRRQFELETKTNKWWLEYLSTQLQNHDDLHQYLELSAAVNGITTEQIKQFSAQYITGDNYIRLVSLPEKN